MSSSKNFQFHISIKLQKTQKRGFGNVSVFEVEGMILGRKMGAVLLAACPLISDHTKYRTGFYGTCT
jgi:hypothetical protein